jgi:hypothetical protein
MSTRIRVFGGFLSLLASFAVEGRCQSTDNPPQIWSFLTPVALGNCQYYQGSDAQENYTIGVTTGVSKVGEPIRVIEVAEGGPASVAGIQKEDALWGNDSNENPIVIDSCELLHRELSGSNDLVLYRQSSSEGKLSRVTVHPKYRRDVYPWEAQTRWKLVSELMGGGRFRVSGTLARDSLGEFELRLGVFNLQTESLLQLDEYKIFLLDDRGTEFAHPPFAEWKQQLESLLASSNALAQGMESVPYVAPPPPPPPTHYRISGSADGRYVLTPMGGGTYQVDGRTEVDSTISPEYTPSEQIGQATRSIASIFDAIRTARTNKEIAKLRKRASENAAGVQNLLAAGTAAHLETTTAIAPGAKRSGAIVFVGPKSLDASTIKAIVVVNDTASKQDYFVTFEFRP